MKKIISTPHAPSAIGPYSQAILVNGTLYTSGQIAINPSTGEITQEIGAATHQIMKNLEALLKEAHMHFSEVVKTSIFLQDMDDFQTVNTIYESYFSNDEFPARETVAVKTLPKNVNIEISMVAVKTV